MSKYGAKKVVIHGHCFASQKEATRYLLLKQRERDGEITDLELQPRFDFVINSAPVKMKNGQTARYTADFAYRENGKRVVEEVKGYITQDYRLRVAIFKHIYPHVEFREVR